MILWKKYQKLMKLEHIQQWTQQIEDFIIRSQRQLAIIAHHMLNKRGLSVGKLRPHMTKQRQKFIQKISNTNYFIEKSKEIQNSISSLLSIKSLEK